MSDLAPFDGSKEVAPVSQQPDVFRPMLEGFDWGGYEAREEHLSSIADSPEATRLAIVQYRDDTSGVGIMMDNLHNRRLEGAPVGNLPASLAVMSRSVITMGLPGLNFRGGVATEATFAGIDLRGADFTDAVMPQTDFREANLGGASFVNAIVNGGNFEGANLDSVDFSGAYLVEATGLTRQQLRSVVLRGARVIMLPEDVERREGMLGTLSSHFSGLIDTNNPQNQVEAVPVALETSVVAQLQTNRNFKGLHGNRLLLNGVDFTRSTLHGMTLIEPVARGVVFRSSQLSGAVVRGTQDVLADMTGADMHSIWAPGSLWVNVDMSGANLAKANLAGSVFRNVDLRGVKGLDEQGTNLEGVVFEHCRLPDGFDYDGLKLVSPKRSGQPELTE